MTTKTMIVFLLQRFHGSGPKMHTYIYIYIYIYRSRAPRPPPNGQGSRPFCGVGCGGVDLESPSLLPSLWCRVWWVGIPLPSSSSVVWGLVGGNPPPSPPVVWGLVGGNPPPPSPRWVGVPLPPPCGVGFGGVEFVLGSVGEVESVVLPK